MYHSESIYRTGTACEHTGVAITIAVLGGIDIFGGRGYMSSVLLGIVLVVVLDSGLQLANVGNSIQTGILGLVLIASVLLNNVLTHRRGGS